MKTKQHVKHLYSINVDGGTIRVAAQFTSVDHINICNSISTLAKWDEYRIDKIDDVILCCNNKRGI